MDVAVDGRPVTGFESATAKALLAWLCFEPGVRHPRRETAEALWPERADGKALANLRHTLATLRHLLDDRAATTPVFCVDRSSVTVDANQVWVDVAELRRAAATPVTTPGVVGTWEHAAGLCRGPFLDGFDPALSEEWERWRAACRAEADRAALSVLARLVDVYERSGRTDEALAVVDRMLATDRWNEQAQVRRVRLLAASDRIAEALDSGHHFVRALADELDAPPPSRLVALMDRIRRGRTTPSGTAAPALPPRPSSRPPVCVARDAELSWLDQHLDDAAAGRGHLVAVRGAAGAGKTVLLRTFAARSHARMPALTVLRGGCNAYGGAGDPYLPFRQMLGLLYGDLEPSWMRGDLTADEATALWSGLPEAVDALLDAGPALLGSLVEPAGLQQRLALVSDDPVRAERLADAVAVVARRGAALRAQQPVLDHARTVLARLARSRPLLMMVDDLHVADQGTLDLLQHLVNGIEDVPLLLVVALRPSLAHDTGSDPVAAMLAEVRARTPDECVVDLVGDRAFVDAWLDVEPNTLDEVFRRRLHRATNGHALFTVETVAALRERGVLVRAADGRWRSESLDWGALPPRVEATIESRILALPPDVRRDVEVASVQGPEFTCEVVAAAEGDDPAAVAQRLGRLTRTPAALIDDVGRATVGSSRVGRYRFRHLLFQRYLYDQLAAADRSWLHESSAQALATLHAEAIDDVVADLARHADAAGDEEEAARYHLRAGQLAAGRSALADAERHLRRALVLVDHRPAGPERDRAQTSLLTLLGACVQARAGYNAPATREVYDRLRGLIDRAAPSMESAEAVAALIGLDGLRAHYADAIGAAHRLLAMSAELGAAPLATIGDMQLGWLHMMTGDPRRARRHLDEAIDAYDPDWDSWLTPLVGFQVRSTARAWRALLAAVECRCDDARADSAEAIAEARAVGSPYGVVFALSVAGCAVYEQLLDGDQVIRFADETAEIARAEGFAFYQAAALVHRGLGLSLRGRLREGTEQTARGLAAWSDLGTEAFRTWMMCEQVQHLVVAGQVGRAERLLDEVDERLAVGEERLAAWWRPLARAAVERARADPESAERTLARATEWLTDQGAGEPLLRVLTARAALLDERGRGEEGRAILAPAVTSVSQGRDTPVVQQARAVLDRLSDPGTSDGTGPATP